ncbi:fibronectin type III domain-containing protein [Paenibacillus sepulcri]|uniref:Fibronectin type III domain-containing protein n=2 Tax=Paenibacillus sepulcri TaxID=359917 RepID=A0ABS7BY38_9BACL|nr:fibronectin type III domain-containing protein [Paenibacillus sepulcri]
MDVLPDNQSQALKANSTGKIKKTVPSFKTQSLPFNLSIPSDFAEGYSIGSEDARLKFIPVGAGSSIGQWNETAQTKVMYTNVWPSTNVELEATDWGIKESIILKDGNAPTRFTFEVIGQLDQELNGKKAILLPAWLKDATGKTLDVTQTLRTEKGKKFLDVSFDPASLSYPILIDPSVYEEEEDFENSFYSFPINLDPTKTVSNTDIYVTALLKIYDFHLTAGMIEISVPEIDDEYHASGGVNSLSLPDNNIVDFSFELGHRSRGLIYVIVTYFEDDLPDTTPPTTPTNLAVMDKSTTSVTLQWTASTDNEGVTGYDIYKGNERIGSSTTNTYTATGLTPNTAYTFSVKAKDAAGNTSSASNVITLTTSTLPVIIPSIPIHYVYDSYGRIDYIQLSSGRILDYQYNSSGNLIGVVVE